MITAVTRKKFTVEQYHRLIDIGLFIEGNRIELIRGDIIEMPAKRTPHSVCNSLLLKELYKLLGDLAMIRGQEPIILPPDSEPEPDVVIARPKNDNYLSSHPTADDILLIIEIADSTLKYDLGFAEARSDRETKLPLYAEYNISNYWLFNLVDYHLEIYSEPFQDTQAKSNYRLKQILLPNEIVTLPYFPNLSLDLSLIFPQ
jgi:Uma2 family endonuclease